MPLSLTVDPVPAPPATPTASVTAQPSARPPQVLLSSLPLLDQLSNTVSGSLPIISTSFTGLMPNNYQVTAKYRNRLYLYAAESDG
ncbi:MAG: hypothetical protein R2822_15160 [Spirosomataceae bacterium]